MKFFPLLLVAIAPGCTDTVDVERKNGVEEVRPVEGIAVLGAREGSWFQECDLDTPQGCQIEAMEAMCDLEVSAAAGDLYSRFLESHGLAGEGAAALKIRGNASRLDGQGFGHMSMSTCQIKFETIQSIELIDYPFAPPPP